MKEIFWKSKYQLKNGDWQGWATYESFEEAKETAEFHAKGRPFQLVKESGVDMSGVISYKDFEKLLDSYGISKSELAMQLGVNRSVFTAPKRRGQFSSILSALIRVYFSTM